MTLENFKSIQRLITSSDTENQILGITMAESNFIPKKNLAQILLLYKYSLAEDAIWETNAPFISETFKKVGIPMKGDSLLSYRDIMIIISEQKCSIEQYKFALERYLEFLVEDQRRHGYDFLEKITVTYKIDPHYEEELQQNTETDELF